MIQPSKVKASKVEPLLYRLQSKRSRQVMTLTIVIQKVARLKIPELPLKLNPHMRNSPIGIAQQTAAALSSGDTLAVMFRTEKDKFRMRYNRSMEPSSEWRPKAAKCPEHIALMIRAAPVKDGA